MYTEQTNGRLTANFQQCWASAYPLEFRMLYVVNIMLKTQGVWSSEGYSLWERSVWQSALFVIWNRLPVSCRQPYSNHFSDVSLPCHWPHHNSDIISRSQLWNPTRSMHHQHRLLFLSGLPACINDSHAHSLKFLPRDAVQSAVMLR